MKMLISLLFVFASGCASIVSHANYPVTIETFPKGKEVSLVDKYGRTMYEGKTPTTLTLPASTGFFGPARYTLSILEEGKPVAKQQFSATLDPWYVGNILFGGLIGLLLVDPATGAMWKLNDHVLIGTNKSRRKVKISDLDKKPWEKEGETVF